MEGRLGMLSRGGSVSRDAAQGFLDSAGAFERFEVDALSARWSAVDIDFLKLIEEQVRKAEATWIWMRSLVEKSAFIFFKRFHTT